MYGVALMEFHAPEALEDSEYVDFSPAVEFQHVLDHLTGASTHS